MFAEGKKNPGVWPPDVTECKFVCLTHVETKQTEMSEFGAEKGLLQGHARGGGWLVPRKPQIPEGFQQSTFKGKVREGRGWLLETSWCWNPLFLQLST